MKLAMTSTEMYDRCMEDKMIKINIKEKEVSVEVVNGVRTFSFDSFTVSKNNNEKYLERLRQLECNVSLKSIRFPGDQVAFYLCMNSKIFRLMPIPSWKLVNIWRS